MSTFQNTASGASRILFIRALCFSSLIPSSATSRRVGLVHSLQYVKSIVYSTQACVFLPTLGAHPETTKPRLFLVPLAAKADGGTTNSTCWALTVDNSNPASPEVHHIFSIVPGSFGI